MFRCHGTHRHGTYIILKKQTSPSPWREADSLLTGQEFLLLGLHFAGGLCPSPNITNITKKLKAFRKLYLSTLSGRK